MLYMKLAEILKERVTLEIECIDRMYLNVYIPQLQREGGVASFFRFHRRHPFASSVLMDPISKAFIGARGEICEGAKDPRGDLPARGAQGRYRRGLSEEMGV